jgi:transposase
MAKRPFQNLKRVLVVLDGASRHTSAKVRVPEYMELFFLPPFTPELQPAERFWPVLDEPLVGLAAKI